MRKQVGSEAKASEDGGWLDLEEVAAAEVSSEAAGFPVENALVPPGARPWKAAAPGKARIALRFDAPQRITRMQLRFEEEVHERTQEWALSDGEGRELLRQGWNFSPGGSTVQDETYTLNLSGVRALTLTIDPDRGRDRYPATLSAWRISAS